VHVVPRRKKDGLKGFFWPRNPYRDAEQMEEVAAKLRDVVRQLYRPL
jgi:histidine triad (HIT) family protein